jgi:septal ring factor EnvC (AmiA/AmiB activator)
MLDVIEKLIKIIGKFNCIANGSKIDRQSEDIDDLKSKIQRLCDKIDSNYYDKEHMNDVIKSMRYQINSNESQILFNHNLLYEKNQDISTRLQSEIQKNSIGLAEIKGLLTVRMRSPKAERVNHIWK